MTQDIYEAFDLATLEKLRDRYAGRGESAKAKDVSAAIARFGAVQTDELSRSGKLFAHDSPRDNSGRVTTSYTGDNGAWMSLFMSGARVGKINTTLAKEAACAQDTRRAT